MSRDGKCSLLLTLAVCVWGFLPASALAWPDAVPVPNKLLRVPQNSFDARDANRAIETPSGALPDFSEYYNPMIDRANFQKNPIYWNMPAVIEMICRNSASVGYSEYLYCVDNLVNLVLDSDEATSL